MKKTHIKNSTSDGPYETEFIFLTPPKRQKHLKRIVRVEAVKVRNFKICLANGNPIMLQAIRRLIAGTPDLEIVGETSDGQGLLDLLELRKPDLVILDIFQPHIHGLAVAKIIKTNYPQIKVIFLTKETDIEYIFNALFYGADSYLLEEDGESTLLAAIDKIIKIN